LRKGSPYALDFHTAVLVLYHYEDLSVDEIEQELTRQIDCEPCFEGPRVKTIISWLHRFRRDAEEIASFFTQVLSEHHFDIPPVLPPDKQASHRDYASHYLLECISALYARIHPNNKHSFRFLMHANSLLLKSGKPGFFHPRPP